MSHAGAESTLSTFTASDGDNLAVQDWYLPDGARQRGAVLVVHGLGEHAGRYDELARVLNAWGFAVRSYDQYGHGESDGTRGGLPHANRLLDDLADLVESTRVRNPGMPLIVLGHSLGGLVAASFVARTLHAVDGLVLSSPALAMRLGPVQRLLMAIVPRIAPNLTVGNGLDPQYLSHDRRVVQAYLNDPRVHDRISGRLALFMEEEQALVRSRAPSWNVPTLLMYAGEDHMVDPGGSEFFAATAPRQVLSARRFEGLYHEILNERDAQPVYACLKQWLDARF
ncbi:lysophospholipase [Ramlibacter sp. USB13]|uniref:Lysophospholipase n=1 Tax=Ramlibacter cellulosilyticus TaxID=2764187 RepID=A0A923MPU1_9BURK|nr:alpha/beta hydrolase [Ramlibacter cellulosilyticus]MBC5782706.1 lysophospholipase [Ramlibacter cellulosilyticus]